MFGRWMSKFSLNRSGHLLFTEWIEKSGLRANARRPTNVSLNHTSGFRFAQAEAPGSGKRMRTLLAPPQLWSASSCINTTQRKSSRRLRRCLVITRSADWPTRKSVVHTSYLHLSNTLCVCLHKPLASATPNTRPACVLRSSL